LRAGLMYAMKDHVVPEVKFMHRGNLLLLTIL